MKKKGTMLDTRSKRKEFKETAKALRNKKNPKVKYDPKVTNIIPYDGNIERDENGQTM